MKISFVATLLFSCFIYSQVPKVSSGKIEHFENFKSSFVDARNIDVWLPDNYSTAEKYAVLYMHDGQMLFDPSITWNKQAWKVDEIAGKLIAEGKTQKFIVVAIWNNGQKRHPEFYPQKAFKILTEKERKFISEIFLKRNKIAETFSPISDNYLKFIVKELKPFIDKTFSTKKDKNNTFIAGSSMGGLISLYAICEYPNVLGAAACLSTHWTGIYQLDNNPIPETFFLYLKKKLPNPKNHRIYFDYGDKTLDSLYPTLQIKVDIILKSKGYNEKNWITKYFPGEDHYEKSWHDRFHIPLEFLMKN
jgi:enterochelin esterase-like enzyme